MGDYRLIHEIGCTNDGGVWISLIAEINGEQQKAIIPMDAKKAKELQDRIGEAIEAGATWKKTGVKPNVGNSANTNKASPKKNKRNRNG